MYLIYIQIIIISFINLCWCVWLKIPFCIQGILVLFMNLCFSCILEIPAKMAKMWILSGQLLPWLATGAGHGPDGSAPYQYRWADVVWVPCCHDCVMGCCGVLVVFHWPLVARGSHILHLGLGLLRARVLGLCCTAVFPLIFLQLRKGPL